MSKRGPKQPIRAERFWMRVEKTDTCWLWTGAVNQRRGGYGYFYDDDTRLRRAHRVAWELTHGPLTEDIYLLHSCDTPRCVRPDHLRVGSQSENLAEMRAKGRGAGLLNAEKVRWVRAEHADGRSCAAIAQELGLSASTIEKTINGKHWAHVD